MSSPARSRSERFARSPLPVFVLIAIAGCADALVMLHSKELLAVYMTGNSTKLGQSLMAGGWTQALHLASVIASFLVSTTLAAYVGKRMPDRRAPVCLVLTAAMLLIAMPFAGAQWSLLATCLVAAGMGAINQTRADQPGVTFITGSLIQFGRQMADGHYGAAALNLLRWVSLIAGAAIGILLDFLYGTGALGVLAGAALACALASVFAGRTHSSSNDGGISHVRK